MIGRLGARSTALGKGMGTGIINGWSDACCATRHHGGGRLSIGEHILLGIDTWLVHPRRSIEGWGSFESVCVNAATATTMPTNT